MSYLVIARKWRPKNFQEIIGQEHITRVLQNAIKLKRVSHAYLFSGPRGIGKTTTARVFAKALNCFEGPTPEPCLNCLHCLEISKGISLDVLEIDGASNRGIDEVRDLRENAKLKSIKARFKIYIIDEVHMLTEPAFNALLKILEEPPEHVKFIFATTQPHKVPLTILSRCQRFDFRPLSQNAIKAKLIQILESEKVNYSEDAILAIAKAAEGSLRDAESLLDQFICFSSGSHLNLDLVNKFLGTIETEVLVELITELINCHERSALLILDKLVSEGKEVTQILENLIQYFRLLILMKVLESQELSNYISLDLSAKLSEVRSQVSKEELLFIMEILAEIDDKSRYAVSPRILLEIGFLKICHRTEFQILNYERETIKQDKEKFLQNESQAKQLRDVSDSPDLKTEQRIEESLSQDKTEDANLIQKVKDVWPGIIRELEQKKMSLAFYLSKAKINSLKDDVLSLSLDMDSNFQSEFLEQRENKILLESLICEKLNRNIRIKCEKGATAPSLEKNKVQELLQNPKLKKISHLLNAKVLKIMPENEDRPSQ